LLLLLGVVFVFFKKKKNSNNTRATTTTTKNGKKKKERAKSVHARAITLWIAQKQKKNTAHQQASSRTNIKYTHILIVWREREKENAVELDFSSLHYYH
jgi:hypothetical protein